MTFIFDRDGISHPWERALRELGIGDVRRRSLAESWRMDHRVSAEREAEDLLACGCFASGCDAEDWLRGLQHYFQARICQSCNPAGGPRSAYLHPFNALNRVTEVAPFDRLCHVGSIQTMVGRVLSGGFLADVAADLADEVGLAFPETSADVDHFATALAGRGEEEVRRAVRILLGGLGETEPPWWACFADEVQALLDTGEAAGICSALGLGHRWQGEWLVVWTYPVSDAGPLYRPTVVEARDSPFHYPSPPEYGLGITMPLDPDQPTCREVLHRPLRGRAAEEGCTGKLLLLENYPEVEDTWLEALRRHHRERLRSEFGTAALAAWLDRHPVSR